MVSRIVITDGTHSIKVVRHRNPTWRWQWWVATDNEGWHPIGGYARTRQSALHRANLALGRKDA